MNPAGVQPDPAAQEASISKIQELSGKNVLTYVIGYDTMGTSFAPVLDRMAAAGGTGDMAHRSVSSGEQLIEEFRSITAGTVSCSFVLAQEVPVRRVKVWIDDQESVFGEDWELRDDGRTVDLLGDACNALQVGAQVEAEVVCEEINLI